MDISVSLTVLGTEHVVLASVDYSNDLEGLKKVESFYLNPKTRKRLFRKVSDVIFDPTKVKLAYPKTESASRVKRFAEELLSAIAVA